MWQRASVATSDWLADVWMDACMGWGVMEGMVGMRGGRSAGAAAVAGQGNVSRACANGKLKTESACTHNFNIPQLPLYPPPILASCASPDYSCATCSESSGLARSRFAYALVLLRLHSSCGRLSLPLSTVDTLPCVSWCASLVAVGKGNEKRRTRDRLQLERASSSHPPLAPLSARFHPGLSFHFWPCLPRAHPLPIPLGCLAKFLNWILWRPKTPTRAGHVNWQLPSGRPFLLTFLLLPSSSSSSAFPHSPHPPACRIPSNVRP